MVKSFDEKLADFFNTLTIKMKTARCQYCGNTITKAQMRRHQTKAKYCVAIQRIISKNS